MDEETKGLVLQAVEAVVTVQEMCRDLQQSVINTQQMLGTAQNAIIGLQRTVMLQQIEIDRLKAGDTKPPIA